jgi:23S rRNA pseudouridine1911/1915/1917 synthase
MSLETDLNITPTNTEMRLDVPPGHREGTRLDAYITQFVQNATRNKVQDAIKSGHVQVNSSVEKASYKVKGGDRIDIVLPKPPPPEAIAENIPLNIIHEDDQVVIINKPAGMVVHPAFGNWTGTLVNGLMHHLDDMDNFDDEVMRPGIVHRLDKDTSGILVVAKSPEMLSKLGAQFADHSIERTYWCIVWGQPSAEGTIDEPIGRSKRDRKVMAVVKPEDGKRAVTHYKVLEYFDHLALVEVRLETGRTHQIRVHMAHISHPVLGDTVYGGDRIRYGSPAGNRKTFFENIFKHLGRQCLHAKTLGFVHPASGEFVRFDSEIPGDFRDALAKLRQHCKP